MNREEYSSFLTVYLCIYTRSMFKTHVLIKIKIDLNLNFSFREKERKKFGSGLWRHAIYVHTG